MGEGEMRMMRRRRRKDGEGEEGREALGGPRRPGIRPRSTPTEVIRMASVLRGALRPPRASEGRRRVPRAPDCPRGPLSIVPLGALA